MVNDEGVLYRLAMIDENTTAHFCVYNPPPQTLTIPGLVTINLETGDIVYGEKYDPDEAARIFWEAIGRRANPNRVL